MERIAVVGGGADRNNSDAEHQEWILPELELIAKLIFAREWCYYVDFFLEWRGDILTSYIIEKNMSFAEIGPWDFNTTIKK